MATITLKISEREKIFLQGIAKLEGISLSELIRNKTLRSIEDEYDAKVADMVLEDYEEYLANGGQVLSWSELTHGL
ncbi:antitoxin [Tuanshanicoccus lijuaniae]|uniref:type II toxin-antitoxin system RelB family antitoxin n=1 Tax=Aerococcaceae bacterium zg-1292 TaxID=2774330 RepID=UPI001937AED0|nr:antitoxin [Aerococcaceae bacterium zg-1292]MBF6625907.1 antitoxin [Aerococcaceae bacterium zg-BR9]MBF6978513.1 antitoxin [Aerococcaceae bacterium zg-BR22]MBS4455495.1 antitoxin [Aerococcaceae bacterium zg-A91]MBS4457114.1 antitoxin [Aerococcaceae bacterium zg-BR33]